MSPDTFYEFKIYLNAFAVGAVPRTPAQEPYSVPQISQLHLSLFERRGFFRVESGVYQYTANHSVPNNTIPVPLQCL